MKKLVMIAAMVLGSVSAMALAPANGENSPELTPEQVAQLTLVGGCAGAKASDNGENTDIVYTEPCNSQTPATGAVFGVTFPTEALAYAHCPTGIGYVQPVYTWGFKIVGYICTSNNNNTGGE